MSLRGFQYVNCFVYLHHGSYTNRYKVPCSAGVYTFAQSAWILLFFLDFTGMNDYVTK